MEFLKKILIYILLIIGILSCQNNQPNKNKEITDNIENNSNIVAKKEVHKNDKVKANQKEINQIPEIEDLGIKETNEDNKNTGDDVNKKIKPEGGNKPEGKNNIEKKKQQEMPKEKITKPAISKKKKAVKHESLFYFRAGNKLWKLDNINLSLDDSTSTYIQVPELYYIYLFHKKNGKVIALRQFNQVPGSGLGKKKIRLSSLRRDDTQDSDWFFFVSKNTITKKEEKKLKKIIFTYNNNISKNTYSIYPRIYKWRIFTCELDSKVDELPEKPFKLRGSIQILSAPFALEVFIKKHGKEEYEVYRAKDFTIEYGDKLQLRLDTYKDIHAAIFLYEGEEVVKLYPSQEKEKTFLLKANTTINFPGEKELRLKNEHFAKYLCCFSQESPMNCKKLKNWLEYVDIARLGYQVEKGTSGIIAFKCPAPLYTINLSQPPK